MSAVLIAFLVIGCTIGFGLYKVFKVPDSLRTLPKVPLSSTLYYLFARKPYDESSTIRYKKLLDENHLAVSWFQGEWYLMVSSPETAHRIYLDTTTFPKNVFTVTSPNNLFSKFLGVNVVFSNGDVWKRHRKVVNPPFKKAFDPKVFGGLVTQLVEVIDQDGGKGLDVHKLIQRLTIDALGKAALGLDFNSIKDPDVPFINHYNTIMGSFSPMTILFPFLESRKNPFRRPAHEALDNLEAHFSQVLDERRAQLKSAPGDDLLSLMIQAGEENNFSDKELRDNIMVFLLAGQDTTAFALSAALFLLATHPEVQAKLRQEIADNIPCHPAANDQLKGMPYLAAVIKETMRLYPSVARLPSRICASDVTIEGHHIPKGTKVLIETFRMHRDPGLWKDPESFVPERFLHKDPKHAHHPNEDTLAYSPFGGGSRTCLGLNFSLLEQKIVLTMIVSQYNIVPTPSSDAANGKLKLTPGNLLSPKDLYLDFVKLDQV